MNIEWGLISIAHNMRKMAALQATIFVSSYNSAFSLLFGVALKFFRDDPAFYNCNILALEKCCRFSLVWQIKLTDEGSG